MKRNKIVSLIMTSKIAGLTVVECGQDSQVLVEDSQRTDWTPGSYPFEIKLLYINIIIKLKWERFLFIRNSQTFEIGEVC